MGTVDDDAMPLLSKVKNLLLAALLTGCTAWGVATGDLFIPGRPSRSGSHFYGAASWCVAGALVSFALALMLDVVRNNRRDESAMRFDTVSGTAVLVAVALALAGVGLNLLA